MANTNKKLVLLNVRFNYVTVWEPQAFMSDEPKYSVCIMVSKKDTETIALIQKTIDELKAENLKTSKLSRCCWRDGDVDRSDNPQFEGYMFINAKTKIKPWVYGKDKMPIAQGSEEIYSGCYGMASINIYYYDNQFGKGISASLNGIQKLRDGERLDSTSAPGNDLVTMSDADDSGFFDFE